MEACRSRMIERVEGWKSSDGRIFKTEKEAIDNQQLINVRDAIAEMIKMNSHYPYEDRMAMSCAYIIAENRDTVLKLLKENV